MSYLQPDDEHDVSVHRLEGSSAKEKGGLVIMKKGPSETADKHVFLVPAPKPSILGLDRLAALKRKEQQDAAGRKKSKVMSYKDDEEEVEEEEDKQKSDGDHSGRDRY